MPTIRHFVDYVRIYKATRKPIYVLCLMILFWGLYDGVMSYIAPLVITEAGLSKTMMGIVIGSSSIAGALFDFVVCRIFTNTYFKRMFMIMFALCLAYPLILFKANTFIIYLIAMAVWGVYYDLKNIGDFDYVGRFTKKEEHSRSFGLLQVFQSVGYLLAPIIMGVMVAETLDWKPFAVAWIFLLISIFFFWALIHMTKKYPMKDGGKGEYCKRNTLSEILLWGKVGKILFPVLVLTLFLNIIDSFFWTVGPLFAESLSDIHEFAGFFMTAYTLPPLLVGWMVGTVTRKYGQKRTAFISLFLGSLFLSVLMYVENPIFTILLIFLSSIFIAMSWPAINGAYADYIDEAMEFEKEIEGLEDFYTNIGYIIGPMMAGFLADMVGNSGAFSLLGIAGAVVAIVLFFVTPRKINVAEKLSA